MSGNTECNHPELLTFKGPATPFDFLAGRHPGTEILANPYASAFSAEGPASAAVRRSA